MSQGYAPKVIKSQQYGELSSYVLHLRIIPYVLSGVYQELSDMIIIMNNI